MAREIQLPNRGSLILDGRLPSGPTLQFLREQFPDEWTGQLEWLCDRAQ